jgi:shikimate 5-dehydrogenase
MKISGSAISGFKKEKISGLAISGPGKTLAMPTSDVYI